MPPAEVKKIVRPSFEFTSPQPETDPAVGSVPTSVIVGTSTMAIPPAAPKSDAYARSPSARKMTHTGPRTVGVARLSDATGVQVSACSSAAILVSIPVVKFADRRTVPSGDAFVA